MPTPLHVPRVNNNDDTVRIVALAVKEGEFVRHGQSVGAVETDKAVLDVPAERDGYVLKILHAPGATASVGSVLLWLGDAATERVPDPTPDRLGVDAAANRPTAKALAMLRELGLDASVIPRGGERLSVVDIEAWLAKGRPQATEPTAARGGAPEVPGELQELASEERAMLATVSWQRDHAVPGYIEIEYDPKPWNDRATLYAQENKLLLPPLLALLAFRLVEIAKGNPRVNATVVDGRRYQYRTVNLGFTVQAGATLYLAVVQEAHEMTVARFIGALGESQRHAMAHKLRPSEATGATLAFTSMARWDVSRHIPVLPPHTSLIVAHSEPRAGGHGVLGATYDHRLLTGFDVVNVLRALAQPSP
jgi:pyruvate/2-oxoglutarate dehydrogenase complex dihydrolipoamide acyltransferase (E2) component